MVILLILYLVGGAITILKNMKENGKGGFNHLEKYEFVNGNDDIPYMKWKKTNA